MWKWIRKIKLVGNSKVTKACEVYKTSKGYKIVTLYSTDGAYVSQQPIYILPLDADVPTIGMYIFKSLAESRKIPYPQTNLSKELLKSMKEDSFSKLYRTSTSCSVSIKDNIVRIEPYRLMSGRSALEPIPEKEVTIAYSPEKETYITEAILGALECKYTPRDQNV